MSDGKKSKQGDLNLDVVNGDDIVNSKKDRIDVRFDRPLVQVTHAEDAGSYEVKSWPMLDDGSETPDPTNAFGFPMYGWAEKKRAMQQAQQELIRQKEQAIAEEQRQIEEERKEQEEQITVQLAEEIRQAAHDEGYQDGLAQGREEGIAQGVEEGRKDGFVQGQEEGAAKGYGDGFIKGREEGLRKGHEEGIKGGETIVLEQVERFRHLADCLANPLRELDSEVTDEIVYMISRLAKVVIGREIKGDTEFLKNSIEKAVSILPSSEKGASVTLNPDDAALVEATLGREYMQSQNWDLKSSEEIAPGDVFVSNEHTNVNWRLNDRIDALLEKFLTNASVEVQKALHESIPGAPEYDEAPKAPLAPEPKLSDFADSIRAQVQQDEAVMPETAEDAGPAEEISPENAQAGEPDMQESAPQNEAELAGAGA